MASSLSLKRLLSVAPARSLNPLLRPATASSSASANAFDVDRRSDHPLHHHRHLSSFPGMRDPFFWRRSMTVGGQINEYSSVAAGISVNEAVEAGATAKMTNILRPLSPHLPIYKPQLSSTTSILNRISGVYLSAYVIAFYLIPVKMGSVCFSYGDFYQFLFYSSKLSLLSTEIAALSLAYHTYAGVRHILMDSFGTVFPSK